DLTGGLTGSFSGTSCDLTLSDPPNSSSCSVDFTPDGLTSTGKVKGTYKASPDDWKTGNNQFTLTVTTTTKTTPTITWVNPADITYGTALGASQLNATASVPGTFVYTPASGTVLSAGDQQTLSVSFTPTDTAKYNNGS